MANKDLTGFVVLVIAGLLTIQSKQILWTGVPFGITWGFVGLVMVAIGLWGIFGDEIGKVFK